MTETVEPTETETSERKTRKLTAKTIGRVLSELESIAGDVVELAGTEGTYEEAGDRLVKYGANPELVAVAVELATARA